MDEQMAAELSKLVRKARNEAMYMRFQTQGNAAADALEDMAREVEKILNKYSYTVTLRPGDSRGLGAWRVAPYGLFAAFHAR